MTDASRSVSRRSRSRSLLLAILHYQFDGAIKSETGKARSILYESLFSLFPDTFGQRVIKRKHGVQPVKLEKDAVMRGMVKDHLVIWHTSTHATWSIELTSKGVKCLHQCMADPRYKSDLTLVRDYFTTPVVAAPQEAVPAGLERIGLTPGALAERRGWDLAMVLQAASDAGVQASPNVILRPREVGKVISEVMLVRLEEEKAAKAAKEHQDSSCFVDDKGDPHLTSSAISNTPDEVVTMRQTDEGAEITITPGWDVEPDEEHVGWALRDHGGDWHLNHSLDALVKGVGVKKVVVVYPLRVRL